MNCPASSKESSCYGQVGRWCLYWAMLLVPFLLGGAAIGLALMLARDRVAIVYGANLLGSGVGAALAMVAMHTSVATRPWK